MAAFSRGASYREVAEQLDLSVGTVQAHIKAARELGEDVPARAKGRPRLINDAIDAAIVQIIKEKGSHSARLIQEELAKPPHSVTLSYEVVRRRVKQLLASVAALPGGNEAQSGGVTVTGEGSTASARGYEEVARDLDMLAETVRAIVSSVGQMVASDGDDMDLDTTSDDTAYEPGLSGDTESSPAIEEAQGVASSSTGRDDEQSAAISGNQGESTSSTVASTDVRSQEWKNSQVAAEGRDLSVIESLKYSDNSGGGNTDLTVNATTAKASSSAVAMMDPSAHVSGRRTKKAEYSPETRALCVHKHEVDGMSYASIAKELGIPQDSVRAIVRKANRTGSVQNAPRSGRPRKTSEIVDRVILQAVKANERSSAKSIQENLLKVFNVKVSSETIRRRVLANTRQRLLAVSSGEIASDAVNDIAAPTAPTPYTATVNVPAAQIESSASTEPVIRQGGSATIAYAIQPSNEPSSVSVIESVASTVAANKRQLPAGDAFNPATTGSCDVATDAKATQPPKKKRAKRGEYSIELRQQCVAMHAQGNGYRRIGQALDMPHTTVRAIVEKVQRTGSVLPAARSGRPRKTDEIVDKVILEAVRANEKCSARMIQEELLKSYDVRISCETIRRRVKDHSRKSLSHAALGSVEPRSTPMSDPVATAASSIAVPTGMPSGGVAVDAVGPSGMSMVPEQEAQLDRGSLHQVAGTNISL